DFRRARHHRDAAHLSHQRTGRDQVRHHRETGARLRDHTGRRRGQPVEDRGDGRALRARADQRDHVLEQPREVAIDLPGRMDAFRRQVHRGWRRVLCVLRAPGRHAESIRHVCFAVRGRGRAVLASRRAGGRGRRLERRAEADQAESLRRAQVAGEGQRRAHSCVAGACEAKARALQVSALDRIPQRPAEDGDRENPALQAAGGRTGRALMALAEAGFLDIDGHRIEYRFVGPQPDKAPTLVLLHEGLGCGGLWNDFPENFAAATGAGAFVYSRAGYGKSSPVSLPRPLSYMHDEARQSLPKLLDAIGFLRGLLIGHSDGASIAAIYAGSHQDHRVGGLVLIAPHFFTEDPGIASIVEARKAYETGDLRMRLARWHDDVDNAFKGWNGAWLDPEFRKWDITTELAYIRVPVLIVQGADDQYGSVKQIEAAERECYCPVEVSLLPGVRHAPHREAPDVLLKTTSEFANRLLRDHAEGAMHSVSAAHG